MHIEQSGDKMRVLVLGASGMLGNAVLRLLAESGDMEVFGTARSTAVRPYFPPALRDRIYFGVDIENRELLNKVFAEVRPSVAINCIGIVIHLGQTHDDPIEVIATNALLPHRLARLCALADARLIHFSSDCIYSGRRGGYRESDPSDSDTLYAQTKTLGELDAPHTLTLRSSLVGHALLNGHGLVDWFLAQKGSVLGYRKAIFSGLTTVELARVLRDIIIPRPDLTGIYHLASEPISKLDFLWLVAAVYGKSIEIVPDDRIVIDRSLNDTHFHAATGYVAPPWLEMIKGMFVFR
jgi:dTDP-4-dehydrorhamnose reductase